MTTKFDHLVIFVSNLDDAIGDFTDLGFRVTRGGSHGLTENALIIFANQTYIELLALKPYWHSPLMRIANRLGLLQWRSKIQASIYCRLLRWVNGDIGPVDWCVSVTDLKSTLRSWEDSCLEVLNSENVSRKHINGGVVRWHLGGSTNPDLPILLEDITPTDHRAPLVGTTDHPNGAKDIRAIVFKVNDDITAQNTVVKFLLTADNQQSDRNQTGITLGGVHVSFRGQYMLPKVALTISSSGDQTQLLDSAKSHGTQIRLIP